MLRSHIVNEICFPAQVGHSIKGQFTLQSPENVQAQNFCQPPGRTSLPNRAQWLIYLVAGAVCITSL